MAECSMKWGCMGEAGSLYALAKARFTDVPVTATPSIMKFGPCPPHWEMRRGGRDPSCSIESLPRKTAC
jgi:hypothetical protein